MHSKALVPKEFVVPQSLETDRMRLRCLTIHDVIKDFEAVMESETRLRTVFRENGKWPEGLTLEQNLAELGWHQTEFEMRTSFAYTVVSLDETKVLGCVYIYPTDKQGYDAKVAMWVRQSQVDAGLDEHLFETVESWIAEHWPLKRPGYPGRRISFSEWDTLPENDQAISST